MTEQKTILVIDDEYGIAELLQFALEDANYGVLTAPNGAISTRSEELLERRCGWCGNLLEPPRPVIVADVDPL